MIKMITMKESAECNPCNRKSKGFVVSGPGFVLQLCQCGWVALEQPFNLSEPWASCLKISMIIPPCKLLAVGLDDLR